MQRSTTIALLAALALLAPTAAASPSPPALERHALSTGDFVAGEAIVSYRPGTDAGERLAVRRAADVAVDRGLELPQTQVVEVDGSVEAAIRRLERQPDVADAQPNLRYRALAVPPPNDSFFGDLWGLQDPAPPNPGVDALAAWERTRGAGQLIAVVDTGVALDHPDIQGNLWTGPGGVHGHDFVDGDPNPDDFDFHGTHVAGTAAAIDGNGIGVAGVAPDAQIMAVRVLDGDGSGSTADIADGIAFAAQNGADVINLSLGGPAGAGDPAMSAAVALADQADAVVVAAAGNDGASNDVSPTTPCSLPQPNLICVAAVTQAGALAGFSNRGVGAVDVGAPGTNVLSAKTDYDPIFGDGFESGLAAWDGFASLGSSSWATTTAFASSPTRSVTDSPAGDYVDDADSELFAASPLDLTSRRGCRVNADLLYEIEPPDSDGSLFDFLFVGAVTDDQGVFDGRSFAGESPGYDSGAFSAEQASISDLGGRADVVPFLGLFSDGAVRADGAYADDVEVVCRSATYANAKTAAGNYAAFSGTSMAAPHVAGVAALVGAAAPGVSDVQIVQAIEEGGTPLPALAGQTATGRTADADGAIAVALGLPVPGPAVPPATPAPVAPTATPVTPPARRPAAARVSLARARATIRVSRRGAFRYPVVATPGSTGRLALRTRRRVAIDGRRVHLTLGARRFVAPVGGRVTVRVELTRRQLSALRRDGRLLLRVSATVRNSLGEVDRVTRRLTLKPPKA
jgi:thermitase